MDKKEKRIIRGNCESCVYYDYNEDYECYECTMNLDQDEFARFVSMNTASCPYYKFYDEYKSVQRQI